MTHSRPDSRMQRGGDMKRIILLAAMLAAAAGLMAQDDLNNLTAITVDDSGYAYGANAYGRAVALFEGSALEAGAPGNAADLSGDVPGIYYDKAGVIDATTGPFADSVLKIRGLGGNVNPGILALVDDRPQSMAVFRSPLLDTLPLDNLESVEFIKGPSSVEYGNQAAAGVIAMKTKKMTQDGSTTVFNVSAGNFSTQDYYMDNMLKTGAFDYTLSAGYKASLGARPNSDSYQQDYSLGLGYDYTGEIRFGENTAYNDVLTYNPGPAGAGWDRGEEACRVKQLSEDVRVEKTSDDFSGKIIIYSDTGSDDFLESRAPNGVTVTGSNAGFSNFGARLMEEWNLIPGNEIKLGFDWQNFGGNYMDHFSEAAPLYTDTDAVRYENDYAPYFVLAQEVGITSVMLGARYGFNSKWGNDLIPQAGMTLSLFEGHKIFVNVSKGYETPAMGTVIFADSYGSLKPEDFWQYEAGFRHDVMDFFSYNADVYQIEGQNLLETDPVTQELRNTGFELARGVEGGAELKLFGMLKLGGLAAYNDPGGRSAQTALFTGKTYISVSFDKKLSVRVEGEFAKDRYDADNKTGKLQDYMLLNAGIGYNTMMMDTQTGFYVDVDNALDNKYDVETGYPAPGFFIKGGMTLKI